MKPLAGIILADQQFPNDNPVLLNNVEKYMASRKWDFAIYLGDGLDMDAISHHAIQSDNRRALENKRLKKDYANYSKILIRHRKILGPKCKIWYFLANHEEWASRLVDQYPGLEGLIEPEFNIPFDKLDIKLVGYRDFIKLGKVIFIHGDVQAGSYTPTNVAKKMVEIYNRNVVFGHHHTLQAYTKISPQGIDETHTGYAIPCLANTKPAWSRGMPTKWLNGFAVVFLTDNEFSILPVVAAKNSFIAPDGKLYAT
jgi:hypothetical protein